MSAEHEPTHAKVEEIPSDDEAPGLEPVETPELAGEAGEGKTQNRNEKKVRKHLSKAGLVPVKDVTKLSVKKGGQTVFIVSEPDVFKSPSGEVYVVFGEAKVDQGGAASQLQQAAAGFTGGAAPVDLGDEPPALVGETAEPVKAEGGAAAGTEEFAAKDIDLVMAQGNCTREKAIEALRKTKGDIVTSIMELTMS